MHVPKMIVKLSVLFALLGSVLARKSCLQNIGEIDTRFSLQRPGTNLTIVSNDLTTDSVNSNYFRIGYDLVKPIRGHSQMIEQEGVQ